VTSTVRILGSGTASRKRRTSSGLSTAGSRRSFFWYGSLGTAQSRSSVTVYRNRRAATIMLK